MLSILRPLAIVLTSVIAFTAQAGVTVIVSTPPPPREVIIEPEGYSDCFIVPQGFYNGIWNYRHRVCEYDQPSGLGMWIAGYWQCIGFRAGGLCTRWNWAGGHWANRGEMAYRRPLYRNQYRNRVHGHPGGPINGQHYRQEHGHGNGYRPSYENSQPRYHGHNNGGHRPSHEHGHE
jgi:hypothetical protein